jgi:hypothetical protein
MPVAVVPVERTFVTLMFNPDDAAIVNVWFDPLAIVTATSPATLTQIASVGDRTVLSLGVQDVATRYGSSTE